jgi:hypothetical protein
MVFVHARNDTTRTAQHLVDLATKEGTIGEFACTEHPQFVIFLLASLPFPLLS